MSWMPSRTAYSISRCPDQHSMSRLPCIACPVNLHPRVRDVGRIGKEGDPEVLNMGVIESLVYTAICLELSQSPFLPIEPNASMTH